MWGVGASVSLPKPIVLLPRAAVSSYANGIPTTAASEFDRPPSLPTPRATVLKPKQQIKIEGQQQRILGSDIVMALQRAAAEKNKKHMKMAMKKKKAQGLPLSPSSSGDIQSGEEEDALEIRPIRINGDWTTRLDNLEARLLLLSSSIR